jgi:hypothetical protein
MLDLLGPFKGYIYLVVGLAFAALLIYVKVLRNENSTLLIEKGSWTAAIAQQATLIDSCNKSTKEFKDRETTLTANAKDAVEKAKVESVENFKQENSWLFRKPKTIVIDKNNAPQFGGLTIELRMNDYISAQDLMNEAIDKRQDKLAKEKEATK